MRVTAYNLCFSLHLPHTQAQVRENMDKDDRQQLAAAETRASTDRMKPAIIVCHSMPTNWCVVGNENHVSSTQILPSALHCSRILAKTHTHRMLPAPMGWAGAKCPPDPREAAYAYLIGRTMLETDK